MATPSSVAEAHVSTMRGRRQLAELCRLLEERAQANPERVVKVKWGENDGMIDFGWARCTIHADSTALTLRAEAEDESALGQVCELIARHLERNAGDEQLTITWQRDGEPIANGDRDRRNNMRAFHRRMRNH